ncbi:MAG TPA: hypothetical protein EYP18_09700, partial [Desulfobacterales bacterium]|nr:hypothetical protein [Desulfobacterales bacterium]
VLVSTLHELFRGERELFKGLYIEDKWNWDTKHPVIKISFGSGDFSTETGFSIRFNRILQDNSEEYGIDCSSGSNDAGDRFHYLVTRLYKKYGQKVVILIDEYDKPILDHITDRELARRNRDKLKSFYSTIKDMDEYIRFVLITGVSKFSRLDLFSGLNNLNDITIDPAFATLCGYTHEEVKSAFREHLKGVDLDKLKEWYNGYNYFGEPVYNPFDILLFLDKGKEYRPYWWSTGNPGFLIDLLKEQPRYLPDLENCMVDDLVLDAFDVDYIDIAALLWQTGYLTFKEKYQGIDGIEYRLCLPNKEIQISLNRLFIQYLTGLKAELRHGKRQVIHALLNADMDGFHNALRALFASIPYRNYANSIIQHYEGYYASVVYAYLASLGLKIIPEDVTNKGQVDMTVFAGDRVYVIEFKVDGPGSALLQIKGKGYHEKHLASGQIVYLVGIEFSSEEKNIVNFEWEKAYPKP